MSSPPSNDQKTGDFDKVARKHCADLLKIARESFAPSGGIEAMIIVAFCKGAAWGLDIDPPSLHLDEALPALDVPK